MTWRRFIYFILYRLDRLLGRRPGPLILNYHSLAKDDWQYSTSLPVFQSQINQLLAAGFHPVSLDDVAAFLSGSRPLSHRSFAVTFDDGCKSIQVARDFLRRRGIIPALFPLADPARADWTELSYRRSLLSWSEIKKLGRSGWEIGCHSLTHPDFSRLTPGELVKQTQAARQLLAAKLGLPVKYFAYPKGKYPPPVVSAVKSAGFTLALTVDGGYIKAKSHPLRLPRVGLENWVTPDLFLPFISPSAVLIRRLLGRTNLWKLI